MFVVLIGRMRKECYGRRRVSHTLLWLTNILWLEAFWYFDNFIWMLLHNNRDTEPYGRYAMTALDYNM